MWTSIVCAWSSRSRSAVGAAQVSESLTTEHIPKVREHALHAGTTRVRTRVGVTWRDGCAAVAAWALDYRSQAVHGWRAWRLMWVQPWRGRCCGRRWDGRRLVARLGGDADLLHRFYCRAIHRCNTPRWGVPAQGETDFLFSGTRRDILSWTSAARRRRDSVNHTSGRRCLRLRWR